MASLDLDAMIRDISSTSTPVASLDAPRKCIATNTVDDDALSHVRISKPDIHVVCVVPQWLLHSMAAAFFTSRAHLRRKGPDSGALPAMQNLSQTGMQ